MKLVSNIYVCIILLIMLLTQSCSTTRKVPDGSYLLRKNIIIIDKNTDERNLRDLSVDEISTYIRQRPNRSDMFRFHLALYNLSGKDSTKWINKRLQSWGEAPVIFDSTLTGYSIANIAAYMRNNGFYHAAVRDSVVYRGKKARVYYRITPNNPYRISKIEYDIADTAVERIIRADTVRLRPGRRLSPNSLNRITDAVTTQLRNNGYYIFNKSFIKFEADTTLGDLQAGLKVVIPPFSRPAESGPVYTDYPVYTINKVYFYPNYSNMLAATDSTYTHSFDTLRYRHIYLLTKNGANLKPAVLERVSLFEEGDLYSEEKVARTYNNLSGLALFKSITIDFREAGDNQLDCLIYLEPFKSQSYKVDLELSTNSSDMIGFSPGLNYGHKNLFKGAEMFNLDFRGVFQYSIMSASNKSSHEYNVGASLNIPRFLMPVSLRYFKTQLPHTQFNAAYVYQNRPDYTRAMGNLRLGYRWKTSIKHTYQFNLLDFYMVKMYDLSSDFYASINNLYLKSTYSNHFILGITGSYIFNNQPETVSSRRRLNHLYCMVNTDIAGNVVSVFNSLMPHDATMGRLIGGMPYSQYVKSDVNLIYTVPVNTSSELVYRAFFGIGKAYGNSISMPFEKMFYAGGANGLRGWQIRELGPGSVSADSVSVFPSQVADLRFELNVEYRFPLFWRFEGAWFADAGNIWSINPSDSRREARFSFDRFYREIALDTGLGLRLNFGYFVLRLDLGCKVYNPGLPESQRFIVPNKWLNSNNFNLHFGINYPFNN